MSDSSDIDARWIIDALSEINNSIVSLRNNGVEIPSAICSEIMFMSFRLTKLNTESNFKIRRQFTGYD